MKQLLKKAMAFITILVVALSFTGCEDENSDMPEIFAGFSHTINSNTVTFINTSTEVRYYDWNFGDGTRSTEINPVKTYANGTYTVRLKITNVAGASAVYEDTIIIGGATSGTSCATETAESMLLASLNVTFKTDQTANIIKDGANFAWSDNPKSDAGINTSCKVGKVTKTGTNPWDNVQINLDAKLDFTTKSGIKLKVFSIVPGYKVLVKLEDKANPGTNTELEVTTTKTSEWEELSFPFAGAQSGKYDKIVLIFDLATKNTNSYFFDDLTLYGTGSGTTAGTCTTEATETLTATGFNMTFKTDITSSIVNDNATFAWVANPNATGINTSCKVGKVTKNGVNPWDNNQYKLNAKLDLTAYAGFKMKVYSAVPGFKVLVKLESATDPGINTEVEVATTKTSEWEELTFPFASSGTLKYDRIVLIFDLSTKNTSTYYFDDLKVYDRTTSGGSTGGGSTGAYNLTLPIDFETTGFGANWKWNVFENVGNAPLEFVANPSASGINTSAKVAKITALKAGAPWVGTETAHGQMGINWDLNASNSIIRIMVYKTTISDVGIKLVNPAGGAQAEIKVANTKINQWEELTFNFKGRIGNGLDGSTNIDQIVVFPDFKDGRAADNVVYFDNITFNAN